MVVHGASVLNAQIDRICDELFYELFVTWPSIGACAWYSIGSHRQLGRCEAYSLRHLLRRHERIAPAHVLGVFTFYRHSEVLASWLLAFDLRQPAI